MYFADISSYNNFNVYKSLLDSYLVNPRSEETKDFFIGIIKKAYELSNGLIAENQIDNTIYNLIIAMVDQSKKYNIRYFKNIDPANIGEKELKTLSGILNSLAATNHEFA